MVNLEPVMVEGEAVVEEEPCWTNATEERMWARRELNASHRHRLD
jgi:hypothetical protein